MAVSCLPTIFCCTVNSHVSVDTELDVAFFECDIQPIVDRSCAFVGCHGDPGRPLHIYSTSKVRIAGEALIGEQLTDKELCANFYSTAAHARPNAHSQLITKPTTLDGSESQYHAGNYLFRADDPESRCLLQWMKGKKTDTTTVSYAPPDCQMRWHSSRRVCRPRKVDCEEAILGPDLPEKI